MEDRSELVKWLRENNGKRPSRRLGASPAEEKAASSLARLNRYAKPGPPPPHLQSLVDEVSQVCLSIYILQSSPMTCKECLCCQEQEETCNYSDIFHYVFKAGCIRFDHSSGRFAHVYQLLPDWQGPAKGRPSAPPANVKRDVIALIDWCNKHNGGQLVAHHLNLQECDDHENHAQMLNTFKRLKDMADGRRAVEVADSLALMDQRFGKAWRRGQGGT
jgi:hypothetical protein